VLLPYQVMSTISAESYMELGNSGPVMKMVVDRIQKRRTDDVRNLLHCLQVGLQVDQWH